MSETFAAQLSGMLQRFNPTRRERAGIAAVVAAVAFVFAGASFDWAQRTATRAKTAVGDLERARTLSQLESSPNYRLQVAHAAERAQRWSFRDETPALAQAHVVESLQKLAAEAGMSGATVAIEESRKAPPPPGSRVRAVTARISGEGDLATYLALLEAVARSEESYAPVGASMKQREDGGYAFSLAVKATVIVGGRT